MISVLYFSPSVSWYFHLLVCSLVCNDWNVRLYQWSSVRHGSISLPTRYFFYILSDMNRIPTLADLKNNHSSRKWGRNFPIFCLTFLTSLSPLWQRCDCFSDEIWMFHPVFDTAVVVAVVCRRCRLESLLRPNSRGCHWSPIWYAFEQTEGGMGRPKNSLKKSNSNWSKHTVKKENIITRFFFCFVFVFVFFCFSTESRLHYVEIAKLRV